MLDGSFKKTSQTRKMRGKESIFKISLLDSNTIKIPTQKKKNNIQ